MSGRFARLILLAAAAAICRAQFDAGFQNRAMAHVRYLAALGNRVAGSEGDAKAIRYIQEQFEGAGLAVSVEPFEFQTFVLEKAAVTAGDRDARVERIAFDPYAGITRLKGEAVFVLPEAIDDWATFSRLELKDKLVLTRGRANLYRLAAKGPRAVAFLSDPDFARLRDAAPSETTIEIAGHVARMRSANVVATLGPRDGRGEVILSAHLDSVRVPGASDNASGIAALLELGRYYSRLEKRPPWRLKFVALGAEEIGMLGAKAYLVRHREDLRSCALLFNMDTIGGSEKMYLEMADGVRDVTGKAPDEFIDKATADVDARWMHLRLDTGSASNVPEWLRAALESTAKELGIDFVASRQMGSDHRVFAQAGIVSTNVAVAGAKTHSPEDVPERIAAASLEKAARLVAGVVSKIPPAK